jgi:hypothetical protein
MRASGCRSRFWSCQRGTRSMPRRRESSPGRDRPALGSAELREAVVTSQASAVSRMMRWRRPYTTDPQVSGKAVPARTMRVSEAADRRRSARCGLDRATCAMAPSTAPINDAAT